MTPRAYDDSWDRPHQPGDQEQWQESDWLTFFDPDSGVGAVYRIGQEPNRKMGQPGLFVFALGGERYYMEDVGGRGIDTPITPEDRWENGYRVGGHEVEALGDGRMRYRWNTEESTGELEFSEGFYTPRDWSARNKGAEEMATLNPDGHLECAGRVRGTVRIGGAEHRVDCFGHRDRSWGFRPAYVPRTRRIQAAWGTTGPAFSFASMLYETVDGAALHTGFVIRDGKAIDVANVRILSLLDSDMASPISGIVILTLENGEVIRVDGDIAQAHGAWAPGTAYQSVGTFMRDGVRGFCDIASWVNTAEGTHIMTEAEVASAVVRSGLSQTVDLALPVESAATRA